ncbi:MAG: cupin domain-containing protein [Endozoicomonas sp.]|uniref:cupin domain-containing protein n=1 Tax=Endozoicomonas sp. TaxID=1892382 RepID=UPI003D9BE9EA
MLNMNFQESVIIETENQEWQPSPASKVFRKPLAREDRESGHATSIVQYVAGASFPEHLHPAGEEILVLSGIFSDEAGNFGPGSYLRNPPGSSHANGTDLSRLSLVLLESACLRSWMLQPFMRLWSSLYSPRL